MPTSKPRKKSSPEKLLKKKLWDLCRAITEERYPSICYTCDKPVTGSNKQLGHFIPSSVGGASLRYHLDNLRWQDAGCNLFLGGNGSEYYPRLVKEIGQARVDALFVLKGKSIKANAAFYQSLIDDYTAILNSYA